MQNKFGIGIDKNFYEADRESLLMFKDRTERLSSNFLKYEIQDDKFGEEACNFFVRNFYGTFHYITREFSPVININYNSTGSFCAMNKNFIELGVDLLFVPGYKQQQKVDAIYAVMLHEMFHKRYTNADILSNWFDEDMTINDLYENTNDVIKQISSHLKDETMRSIFNILEDRRIERLGIEEFPGYVFYFDELRNFVFDIHLKKEHVIDISIFINYLLYAILLPEMRETYFDYILEKFQADSAIAKKDFVNYVKNIDAYILNNPLKVYSDDFNTLIAASKDIYEIIPKKYINEINNRGEKDKGPLQDIQGEGGIGESEDKEGKKEKIEEMIQGIIEQLDEEYSVTTIDKVKKERINIIDCSRGHYEFAKIFNPKCSTINVPIYNQAKIISSDIARNLGFISSRLNMINQEFELNEGDIDEDELYSIGYSNNLFYTEEPKAGFSFDLGILIDESGSMAGIKKTNAIIAALGCILGAKDNAHVNLFVYGHSNSRHRDLGEGVELYEYFNKKRGVSDWKNIFAVGAAGGNADGYAIAKMGEIMIEDSAGKNKILIVISDGYPAAKDYGGPSAEAHVKSVVDMLDSKGIEIVQICIDNIHSSPKMFKNYIPFDNIGNFIKKFKNFLHTKLVRFSEEI